MMLQPDNCHRSSVSGSRGSGGFTLIEVLFAITLVAVVAAIVYESFAAVTDATGEARLSAEEMRIREFLTKSFSNSFSTVCVDPAYYNEQYYFVGIGGSGGGSSMASVEFSSSAPLMGGMAPPGFCKRVHYGVASPGSSMTLGKGDTAEVEGLARSTLTFEATETLVSMTAVRPDESGFSKSMKADEAAAAFGLDAESPAWTAPVAALDFSYFDGEKWVEEWDSSEMLRMPWCVRIRLNFARTEQEADNGNNSASVTEDPDFEMYIPIPIGMGVWTPADQWLETIGYSSYYAGEIPDGQTGTGGSTTGQPTSGNATGRPSQAGTGTSTTSGGSASKN